MVHLILVDVDAKVRFSWLLLGREPAGEEELLYVYVALLGHAMDISATRLSLMAPGVSASGLTDALQILEEHGPLRRADAATVEFLSIRRRTCHIRHRREQGISVSRRRRRLFSAEHQRRLDRSRKAAQDLRRVALSPLGSIIIVASKKLPSSPAEVFCAVLSRRAYHPPVSYRNSSMTSMSPTILALYSANCSAGIQYSVCIAPPPSEPERMPNTLLSPQTA
jgi:hypothetical protein